MTALLALVRGTVVTLIALLLLNPVIRSLQEELHTPVVLIGVDQSESIAQSTSDTQLDELTNRVTAFKSRLNDDYNIRLISIQDEISEGLDSSFSASQTNLSAFLDHVEDQYSHQNLAAIIMASDGIFNVGRNPLYHPAKFQAPLHTIRLGDTTVPTDVNIRNIFHNEIAFLNDRFEVEVDIESNNCGDRVSNISIYRYENQGFKKLKDQRIRFESDDDFKTLEFELNADEVGVQRYQVRATGFSDEINKENNRRDLFIEVLDSRIRLAVVRHAPHPDIGALKALVDERENYELKVYSPSEALARLEDIDLAILHNITSSASAVDNLVRALDQNKVPRLIIASSQTEVNRFNSIQNTIEISGSNVGLNEVQAIINKGFNLFQTEDGLAQKLSDYPPLISPFGEYALIDGAVSLADQKISSVPTEYPLIAFNEVNGIKEGVIAGEGLWRWRLIDYAKTGSHETIDGLMAKIFQYLSVKENKEQFRVKGRKNLYDDGEEVQFTAEVYNNAYEPVNEPEVYLVIYSESGEEYTYTFSRSENGYILDAGKLKPGNYTYVASTTYAGTKHEKRGNFAVRTIELEFYNTVADHNLLRLLSEKYGGRSVSFEQTEALFNELENADIKPTVSYSSRTRSAMNIKWIFAILVSLLAIEWFLRRYYGRY